jgi:tRNA (cytidine/uridine-2'-O-)-methyltransferase
MGSPEESPLFHVVLHEPEIPNNTGNIGRTCIATGCALHLIRPFGFDTSVKALRRAGLDYWPRLATTEYDDWDSYVASTGVAPERMWIYTTKTDRPHWDVQFRRGDHLVFGKETRGLPDELMERYSDRLVTLPMVEGERSLNVATAVCAAVYEGMRQVGA